MIKILKYKAESKGAVIGYVDVLIDTWNLIIRHIAHLEKNGKRWFNLPQFSTPGIDLKAHYERCVDFATTELNGRFLEALKTAVDQYLEKPVNPEEINQVVNGFLEKEKEEKPLPPPPWQKELF